VIRALPRGACEVCGNPFEGLLSPRARSNAFGPQTAMQFFLGAFGDRQHPLRGFNLTVGSWLVSGDRNPSGFL
jgi:hypothetical protein